MAGRNVSANVVIRINDREVTNSFNGINKEVKKLERELKGMTAGTEEFKRKAAELKEAKKHLEAIKKEIQDTNKNLNDSKSLMEKFKASFLGNIAADFFSNAKDKVIEWGKALVERVQELVAIKSNLSSLDGTLKGMSLDRAAVGVQAIADTYGKTTEEIMGAVKGLNSMTGDTNKSLDLIKKGFDAGADASGEMLTQLKEYPTMMNDAKVSAEQMIAIMSQAEKMSVYDDKGIDAIKEGMLKVREGTKATKDAMRALGIDVDATYKKVSSGAMSYFDVLKLVSKKIEETGADSRVTGTAIADIFGGPGEDAGYKYLSQIQNINTDLNAMAAITDKATVAKKYELEANEKLNSVWVQLTGTASLLSKGYSALKMGLANTLETMFNIKQAKLSDEYLQEEYRLRYLKSQLDQTNISQNRRIEIYNELKSKWPQYFSGLDLEKMKHDDITKAVNRSIDALGRKYKAQVFQEKFDKTNLVATDKFIDVIEYEEKGQAAIGQFLKQFPDFKFKAKTTVNQLREIQIELDKTYQKKRGDGTVFDAGSWSIDTDLIRTVRANIKRLSDAYITFNIADQKRINEQNKLMKLKGNLLPDIFNVNPKSEPSTDRDLDAEAAAKKEAEAAAKQRLKDANTAKNDLEKAKDTYNKSVEAQSALDNKLLEMQMGFEEEKNKIKEDSRKKDQDAEDLEYQKKLQAIQKEKTDLLNEITKSNVEIEKLQRDKTETKSPAAKKILDEAIKNLEQNNVKRKALIDDTNKQQEIIESTHRFNLKKINEKWDAKDLEEFVKKEGQLVAEKLRKNEDEIQNITSLEEVKKQLKNNAYLKLTRDELDQIDSLEKGKAALRELANRKALEEQLVFLEKQRKQISESITQMTDGPEKQKLLDDLEKLKDEITKIRGEILSGKESDKGKAKDAENKAKESVDILGFSAKDWTDTFDNLETLQDGLKAAGMVFQALGNAANMFGELQRALGEKELKNYRRIQDHKKQELDKNLALGLISQENYKKQTELLDAELANKQAEIEYKQAKADKASKLFSAIGATAVGVASALSVAPPLGIALAAIVGALGAVQIATIAAQPLPEMPSYAKGGYFEGFTGDSSHPADETGERPFANVRLHRKEWVAPRWMTEHPRISPIINNLEFMRANKMTRMAEGGFPEANASGSAAAPSAAASENNAATMALFYRILNLFQKIDDEGGIEAYIAENPRNEKKMREMVRNREKLINKQKR